MNSPTRLMAMSNGVTIEIPTTTEMEQFVQQSTETIILPYNRAQLLLTAT